MRSLALATRTGPAPSAGAPRRGGPAAAAARAVPSRRRAVISASGAKTPTKDLRRVAEQAAAAGAEVVMAALARPRAFSSKGTVGDIVTATDKESEAACVAAIAAAFPDHAILGEEGGMLSGAGTAGSDYLWCIDPLDGTVNFAHAYPGFCVSIGVLRHALPVAGCVVEFTGGPGGWSTRTYSGGRNLGSTVDGRPLLVSGVKRLEDALIATEFNCPDERLWPSMAELFRDFTSNAMGMRASGAAAVNLCHLAAGQVDAYFQYLLKPWDVAAGVVILEEAGGRLTTADGAAYSVFDGSLLATNDALYGAMLERLEGPTRRAHDAGVPLGPANVPAGFRVRSGAQLE
ncbi:IMPL1 [Scenedesmus sp. PABB004]|nr:IMPL1 [Scenedesmus sp. PABB004]